MENVKLGDLLRVKNNTYGWRGRVDHHLQAGEIVMLCDLNTEVITQGIPTLGVLHPRFGKLICLAMDLGKVKNRSQLDYN
jgi:hypothetical protein